MILNSPDRACSVAKQSSLTASADRDGASNPDADQKGLDSDMDMVGRGNCEKKDGEISDHPIWFLKQQMWYSSTKDITDEGKFYPFFRLLLALIVKFFAFFHIVYVQQETRVDNPLPPAEPEPIFDDHPAVETQFGPHQYYESCMYLLLVYKDCQLSFLLFIVKKSQ